MSEGLKRTEFQERLSNAAQIDPKGQTMTPLDMFILTTPIAALRELANQDIAILVQTDTGFAPVFCKSDAISSAPLPLNQTALLAAMSLRYHPRPNLTTLTVSRGDTSVQFTSPKDETDLDGNADEKKGIAETILSTLTDIQPFSFEKIQTAFGSKKFNLVADLDLKTNNGVYYFI